MKTHNSVIEMLEQTGTSREVIDSVRERMQKRQLVKALSVLRNVLGLSQTEVAQRIGCTQAKISKLESGMDAGVKIGDLDSYATALGIAFQIRFMKSGESGADKIKYHICSAMDILHQLAALTGEDDDIHEGVSGFFVEAVENTAAMFKLCLAELERNKPETAKNKKPEKHSIVAMPPVLDDGRAVEA